MITSTNRGYLNINRIDTLRFFPILPSFNEPSNSTWMENQFVTINAKEVCHLESSRNMLHKFYLPVSYATSIFPQHRCYRSFINYASSTKTKQAVAVFNSGKAVGNNKNCLVTL